MDEGLLKAASIRAHQGYHEAEVSCTGEAGLQQSFILCDKNFGHSNFIPINDFHVNHLPLRYRDNDIVELVTATSAITCRLSVTCTSNGRPDFVPGSDKPFPFSAYKGVNWLRVGSGWVSEVNKYMKRNNMTCECEQCCQLEVDKRKKEWGEVWITTACHVVFDDEEARHTKCQFFYNSHEIDVSTVLTLKGVKVMESGVPGDWCEINCVTHDLELIDKFAEMFKQWWDQYKKVVDKYLEDVAIVSPVDSVGMLNHDLCIIVSHPHGRSKQVTVGTWTHKQVTSSGDSLESCWYRYNTPTCPGSSGAQVLVLGDKKPKPRWQHWHTPACHSQGRPGNDNNSSIAGEIFSLNLP